MLARFSQATTRGCACCLKPPETYGLPAYTARAETSPQTRLDKPKVNFGRAAKMRDDLARGKAAYSLKIRPPCPSEQRCPRRLGLGAALAGYSPARDQQMLHSRATVTRFG
jgi:hypothetical protein